MKKKSSPLILLSLIAVVAITGCVTTEASHQAPKSTATYASVSGREFTFAPIFASGQSSGYHSWYSRADISPKFKLPYHRYVGKKGKLIEGIIEKSYPSEFGFQKAVVETGEVVYTSVNRYAPKYYQVYFDDELSDAKSLLNKTIYINISGSNAPQELITPNKGVSYDLHNLEAVKVVKVALESYGHSRGVGPFYLEVQKKTGEIGLIKYKEDYFYENDPIPPETPEGIVDAIHNRQIQIGMTEKQATLSWGEPKKKNKSVGSWGVHEQWVYDRQYLYFSNYSGASVD